MQNFTTIDIEKTKKPVAHATGFLVKGENSQTTLKPITQSVIIVARCEAERIGQKL